MEKGLFTIHFEYHFEGKPKKKHNYTTIAWVEDGAKTNDFVQVFAPANVNATSRAVITKVTPVTILTVKASQ